MLAEGFFHTSNKRVLWVVFFGIFRKNELT